MHSEDLSEEKDHCSGLEIELDSASFKVKKEHFIPKMRLVLEHTLIKPG